MKIFFDLDGTLVDVSKRHYKVYSEATNQFGGTPLDQETYWNLKRSKTGWPELLGKSQLNPEILNDFLKVFIEKIESPEYLEIDSLFPGAPEILQAANRKGDCYLVSLRRNKQNLAEEIRKLSIDQYFKETLSAHSETDGSDKKTELIKSKLSDDEEALIIGDTEADIKTGKALGIGTVAVLSGIRDEEFLANLQPDHMIATISELADLI